MSEITDISPKYVVHFFIGRAESEEQKLCHWTQWEQCFHLLDDVLKEFGAKANLSSDQDFIVPVRNLKSDPPGTKRITLKTVPHISRLRWTHAANRLWTSTLEGNGPHPVSLNRTRIASSKIGIPKHDGSGREIPEICILLGDQIPVAYASVFNQSFMMAVSEHFYATRTVDYWSELIARLSLLIRAVRVGRTICPWSQGIMVSGSMVSTCVGFDSYAIRNSLDFNTYFHKWDYLGTK